MPYRLIYKLIVARIDRFQQAPHKVSSILSPNGTILKREVYAALETPD
jgi:hypothetical protein